MTSATPTIERAKLTKIWNAYNNAGDLSDQGALANMWFKQVNKVAAEGHHQWAIRVAADFIQETSPNGEAVGSDSVVDMGLSFQKLVLMAIKDHGTDKGTLWARPENDFNEEVVKPTHWLHGVIETTLQNTKVRTLKTFDL